MYTYYYDVEDIIMIKIDEIFSLFDKYDNPNVGTDNIYCKLKMEEEK